MIQGALTFVLVLLILPLLLVPFGGIGQYELLGLFVIAVVAGVLVARRKRTS